MTTIGIVAASRRRASAPPTTVIPTTGLLAAYGMRRLIASYAGPAIRVRRSDNAEQDIGFTGAGHLNTAALASFLGAGTGFVTRLYDQSGRGMHATQATAARQPVIAPSKVNGRPGMGFQDAGAVRALTLPAGIGVVRSFVAVAQHDYARFSTAFSAGAGFYHGVFSSSGNFVLVGANSDTWTSPPAGTLHTDGVQMPNTSAIPADLSRPHLYVLTTNAGIDMAGGHIGSDRLNANRSWEGEIPDVLFYGDPLTTADRQSIEANVMPYYGIV